MPRSLDRKWGAEGGGGLGQGLGSRCEGSWRVGPGIWGLPNPKPRWCARQGHKKLPSHPTLNPIPLSKK